jgi:uncharacterized protein (DUF433 family)
LRKRLSIVPPVCSGKPCICGTRIRISLILNMLANGLTVAGTLSEYLRLTEEKIFRACIAYGAEVAPERYVEIPNRSMPVRFKVDENFPPRFAGLIRKRGYEATGVRKQGLQGITDQRLYEICCSEKMRRPHPHTTIPERFCGRSVRSVPELFP